MSLATVENQPVVVEDNVEVGFDVSCVQVQGKRDGACMFTGQTLDLGVHLGNFFPSAILGLRTTY